MVGTEDGIEARRRHRPFRRIRVCLGGGSRMGQLHRYALGKKQAPFFDQGPLSGKTHSVPRRFPVDRRTICPYAGHTPLPIPCITVAGLPDAGPSRASSCRSAGNGPERRGRVPGSGRAFPASVSSISGHGPFGDQSESLRAPSPGKPRRHSPGFPFSGWCCQRRGTARKTRLDCDRRHKISVEGSSSGDTEALKKRIFPVINRPFL